MKLRSRFELSVWPWWTGNRDVVSEFINPNMKLTDNKRVRNGRDKETVSM